MNGNSIFIIAGEASGDLHGAGLIKEIKKQLPELEIWAVGGEKMKEAGAQILIPSSKLSVVGLMEIASHLGPIIKSYLKIRQWLKMRRPKLLVLIDFPEFNLMMAKYAKSLGIKVFYYISPQLWAWRQGRVKKIKKYVDKMAVILPFEKAFYEKHNYPVEYVGHPLMDYLTKSLDLEAFKKRFGLIGQKSIICLLPGSRKSEVESLLPVMLEVASRLTASFGNLNFLLPIAPGLTSDVKEKIHQQVAMVAKNGVKIQALEGHSNEALLVSKFAIIASGTASLEAAILGCPMIVLYKLSKITFFLARLLVKVKWVSLVNLIAEKEVVPEFLQDAANPDTVFNCAFKLLRDESLLEQMKKELLEVRQKLGEGGATKRAANLVVQMVR